MSAATLPSRAAPSPITRSAIFSTAAGVGPAAATSSALSSSSTRARVARAIAACAHFAALPCSPPGSASPRAQVVAETLPASRRPAPRCRCGRCRRRRGRRSRRCRRRRGSRCRSAAGMLSSAAREPLRTSQTGNSSARRRRWRRVSGAADVEERVRERAGDPVLVQGMRRRPRRRRRVPAATRGPRE